MSWRIFQRGVWILWCSAIVLWTLGALKAERLIATPTERWIIPLAGVAALTLIAVTTHVGIVQLAKRGETWLRRLTLVLPTVTLCWAGWPASPEPMMPQPLVEARPAGPNDIVLITLDTFRADHLGALGDKNLTPNLDDLAASGALFAQAVTTAPLTGPAHASMFTGMNTLEHGAKRNGSPLEIETFVPQLAAVGYDTAAFVSASVLDRRFGLAKGFRIFDDRFNMKQRLNDLPILCHLLSDDNTNQRPGRQTVARAIQWLDRTQGPRFMWVHLYDPHSPYLPPAEFAPSLETRRAARIRGIAARTQTRGRKRGSLEGLELRAAELKLMYEGEIRHTDALVGELLEHIPADAVVLVVGDHGESLDEHDYYFNHGATLWEQSLQVPLIMRWPGQIPAGTVVSALTSIEQVAPTLIAAAFGGPAGLVSVIRGEAETISVLSYTQGQQARADPKKQNRRFGIPGLPPLPTANRRGKDSRDPRRKVRAALRLPGAKLLAVPGRPPAYFDLIEDPGELSSQPVPRHLAQEARRVDEALSRPSAKPSADDRELLRSLGYVE